MILIDTNVFLEILLEQERAEEASNFIDQQSTDEIFISDFTIHSVGVIMFRPSINKHELYHDFVHDVLLNAGVRTLTLSLSDTPNLVSSARNHNLDFDDAYQYVLCKKHDLDIASYDSDFDSTNLHRIEP
ncbi:MAG: type II toxin-antitoxin system VapC family toxin [Candidatus Thorarchaeota archaeon]